MSGIFVGIDPGLSGAIAIINVDDNVTFFDTPTFIVGKKRAYNIPLMVLLLETHVRDCGRVALEQVHSMPGQGVASTFSFGMGYGIWLGILAALRISVELVPPRRWRGELLAGFPLAGSPRERKAQAAIQAGRLFPRAVADLSGPRGGPIDGRADALLLAEYIRRRK